METVETGKKERFLHFMRYRLVAAFVSITLIVLSIYTWISSGDARYGIDFIGGSELVVRLGSGPGIGDVRQALTDGGIVESVVQEFNQSLVESGSSSEFSIRVRSNAKEGTGKEVRGLLADKLKVSVEILKEDFVGPVVGDQIRSDGILAIILSLVGILIYITVRFEFKYALGVIVALIHDVTIASGLFILSGREFNVPVLAALLTIIGYSVHDTVIIFDRVRETLAKERKLKVGKRPWSDIVDVSLNETLSRTLLTSLTVLFVVTVLWIMGGGAVADLSFTLVIGVIVGTYSSMYVACPIFLLLNRRRLNE